MPPLQRPLRAHIPPHGVSSGLLPQGLMGKSFSLELQFSCSLREKHSGEAEGAGGAAAAAAAAASSSLCLLDVTIMEICISAKRLRGPLGPHKNKYFNNKHFCCLAPGFYFTLMQSDGWIIIQRGRDGSFFFFVFSSLLSIGRDFS